MNINDITASEIKLLGVMSNMHNAEDPFPIHQLKRVAEQIYIPEDKMLEVHFKVGLTATLNCME